MLEKPSNLHLVYLASFHNVTKADIDVYSKSALFIVLNKETKEPLFLATLPKIKELGAYSIFFHSKYLLKYPRKHRVALLQALIAVAMPKFVEKIHKEALFITTPKESMLGGFACKYRHKNGLVILFKN